MILLSCVPLYNPILKFLLPYSADLLPVLTIYASSIIQHIAPETNVFYIGPGNLTKQIVVANNCMGYTVGWDRTYIGQLPLRDPEVPVMSVSSVFIFMSICLFVCFFYHV